MDTMTCMFRRCSQPATFHAFSTVNPGADVHCCEAHAPAWLKAGLFTAHYSAEQKPVDTALAARLIGQLGGKSTSAAKTAAARANGAKGGRPRKTA